MISLTLKLVTPERAVALMEAAAVTLPIADGDVTILPTHTPYIGALKAGEVIIRLTDGKTESLAVSGGFVEFDTNTLSILADTAERAEEIDMERAEAARARAEAIQLKQGAMGEEEYARVAAALEKEMIRIRVVRKHRSRVGPNVISQE
ncbi:MAG: ATP synthase F1 subunit epsilon [Candidatus Moraniibacteriota bacterium]|nr:MAG: ATP synthase F1 subunit epsilon [Candidatus Moranbacteria bacterium]